jgi:DDE superfamily endonuclease
MYEYWLENLFIPATAHLNRPLLLIIDGHASHISLKVLNLLRANQIICLILPSHSTHALQPLDVVVFNIVKQNWSAIVRNHLKHGHKTVKNSDFARLMNKLFIDTVAFTPSKIVSSFSRAGES